MHSASNPHAFMGVTEQGLAAIVKTRGNADVHVILRGGTKGPNFKADAVKAAAETIEKKRGWASIMVDCSRMLSLIINTDASLMLFRWKLTEKSQQPASRC